MKKGKGSHYWWSEWNRASRCRAKQADGYEPVIIDLDGDGIRADLSDPEQTAASLKEALKGGPITRLVNNVGIIRPALIEDQTYGDFEKVMSLNLRCAMQCTQALLPGMKEAGFGRIVNMSSRAALGKELRTAYAASKQGCKLWPRSGLWSWASTASRRMRLGLGPLERSCSPAPIRLIVHAPAPSSMLFPSAASVCRKTWRTQCRSCSMSALVLSPGRCYMSVAA